MNPFRSSAGLRLLFLPLLALPAAASAQTATFVLAPTGGPAAAGSEVGVWLYCINASSGELTQRFRRKLEGSLSLNPGRVSVDLLLKASDDTDCVIPIGALAKKEYVFTIPAEASGSVTLTVGDVPPLTLGVAPAPAATAPASAAAGQQGKPLVAQDNPLFGKVLNSRISPYEPIFFVIGTHPSVEFQFSVKGRILDPDKTDSPFGNVYFGYTQTSFWDLLTSDPKFYDTSYKPSFFFSKTDVQLPDVAGRRSELDVQYGYEHESNGEGGTMERSLNTIYFQPTLTVGDQQGLHLTLQPRVWYYLSVGKYDQDLADYRGYASLRSFLTWRRYQLSARYELGDAGTHPSTTLDFRMDLKEWHLEPTLQIEYFTGYGENLRDYNVRDTGLRAGFSLWYPKFDGK